MPRTYQRKVGSRRYKDYTEEKLIAAVNECKTKHVAVKDVAKIYNIPIRTLRNKLNAAHSKNTGRPQAISVELEDNIVQHLLTCAEYGMPLETHDIRFMVKATLDSNNQTITRFCNNVPGLDWVRGFLSRHKDILCQRTCQNIKRSRAEVKPEALQKYFNNLKKSLDGIPAENILNYDETNLADDPGQKKCIFKRGVKYPERVINFSKGNISVMFAGTASGELIPPYVIYKSEHLWQLWCEGGPAGTRYGRSKSGWMDMTNFEEWFLSVVVPWARKLNGRKVIIGDNLSSHLSKIVIDKCRDMNIAFVLLPPNSTDKCQPLDVSFFAPLKKEWRKQLEDYRQKNPSSSSLDKSLFPRMLRKLIEAICGRQSTNLISGFRACGIYPLDANQVLRKFPQMAGESCTMSTVSSAVLEYLHQFKYSPAGASQSNKPKRKKVMVSPGKSISAEDMNRRNDSNSTTQPQPPSNTICESQPELPSTSNTNCVSQSELPSTSAMSRPPTNDERLRDAGSDSDFSGPKDVPEAEDILDTDDDEEWIPPTTKRARRNIFDQLSR